MYKYQPKINTSSDEALKKLDNLVGMDGIKERMHSLADEIKQGKTAAPDLNMVFNGAWGTGKSTVAEILTELFYSLGAVKELRLISCNVIDLVADCAERTAVKTREAINEAAGGVLYIDNAYQLESRSGFDAIQSLVNAMDEYCGGLTVILANDAKDSFLNNHPELKCKFNNFINFSGYSAEELCEMVMRKFAKHRYIVEKGAKARILAVFENILEKDGINCGYGVASERLFKKIVNRQLLRLMQIKEPTKEDLPIIKEEDIPVE